MEHYSHQIMSQEAPKSSSLTMVHGEVKGEYLYIVLQGPSVESVTSAAARQEAYGLRHKFGFGNAGLESIGGPYPVDLSKDNPETPEHKGLPVPYSEMKEISARPGDLAYRNTFRITRSPL